MGYNFSTFLDEMFGERLANIGTNPFFWGEQEFIVPKSPDSFLISHWVHSTIKK